MMKMMNSCGLMMKMIFFLFINKYFFVLELFDFLAEFSYLRAVCEGGVYTGYPYRWSYCSGLDPLASGARPLPLVWSAAAPPPGAAFFTEL